MSEVVWVTGARGFTGRHMLKFLASQECRALALAQDCTDREALTEQARKDRPGAVIHLAGTLPPEKPGRLFEAHVQTTITLLVALHQAKLQGTRLLTVGSAAEYLPPYDQPLKEDHPVGGLTPYGQSKAAQTASALELGARLGIEVVVVRPFNLVGPGMSSKLVLGWLAGQYRQGCQRVVLGNLDACRDFVDVREAVPAYWGLLRQGQPGQGYNLCSGRAVSVRQLCQLLERVSGCNPELAVDPARLRPGDPATVVGDGSRLQELLGWAPHMELEQSVQDTLAG